jgi:hypothetical protein
MKARWMIYLFAAMALFLVGGTGAWLSRIQVLHSLIDPWRRPNLIIEAIPSQALVTSWFCLWVGVAGGTAALPTAALFLWRMVAPCSCPRTVTSVGVFVGLSYAAMLAGFTYIPAAVLPSIIETFGADTTYRMVVPWGLVEPQLLAALELAALIQAAVVGIVAIIPLGTRHRHAGLRGMRTV